YRRTQSLERLHIDQNDQSGNDRNNRRKRSGRRFVPGTCNGICDSYEQRHRCRSRIEKTRSRIKICSGIPQNSNGKTRQRTLRSKCTRSRGSYGAQKESRCRRKNQIARRKHSSLEKVVDRKSTRLNSSHVSIS